MAEGSIDVLMRIEGGSGVFAGEASTSFETDEKVDKLRTGFKPGFFCELQEFSFSAGVESAMKDPEKLKKAQEKKRKEEEAIASAALALAGKPVAAARPADNRPAAWIEKERLLEAQRKSVEKRARTDFVDMQPVEFTRIMDSSSTLLFTALVESETLPSITVVKRKASGKKGSGLCYLRLDFKKVLMIDLGWKDATHVMIETGSFIYREVQISYAPQDPNGSLRPAIVTKWVMQSAR